MLLGFIIIIVIISIISLIVSYPYPTIIKLSEPKIDALIQNNKKPRVIVSVTTIPTRLGLLEKNMRYFLETQEYKPDVIYLNIPLYSHRLKKPYPGIDLNLPDNIIVNRCNDYGAATKLIGCLNHVTSPDDIIITIDDDQIYQPFCVKNLVAAAIHYPNAVIGYTIANSAYMRIISNSDKPAVTVEGYGGVVYRRKHISEEMRNYFNTLDPNSMCFKSDDLTISHFLNKQKIRIMKLHANASRHDNPALSGINPLYAEQRNHTYKVCLSELAHV